jgi:hypothetical protein
MNEKSVVTHVDSDAVNWKLRYKDELACFLGEERAPTKAQALFSSLPEQGYLVLEQAGLDAAHLARKWITDTLYKRYRSKVRPELYHELVTDEGHKEIISESRNLNYESLFLSSLVLSEVSKRLRLNLDASVYELDRSHVQIRIVRPGSPDFNPPHRDSYLSYYQNIVNIWIPVASMQESIMPIAPGSHLFDENKILRTKPGMAFIGENPYTVPAIVAYNDAPIEMTRPNMKDGDVLVFSPYCIHGLGVNPTNETRVALELRFSIV